MNLPIPFLMLCAVSLGARANPLQAGPRRIEDLNSNCRFVLQDEPFAQAPGFNDAAWQNVTLPHCWNVHAGQAGDTKAYYNGAGWYRRHIAISASDAGKRFYLRFEGAFVVTDVYVNGAHAGRHDGGFAAFCVDITRFLKPGRDNLLAVRVDGSPDAHPGPPQGGDYSKFGGLYRGVRLLVVNPITFHRKTQRRQVSIWTSCG